MGLGFTIHTVQYDLAVRQTNCLICIEDDGKSFTKINCATNKQHYRLKQNADKHYLLNNKH